MRDLLELDDDFGDAGGESLACAQIERHAGPAPVGDLGLDGDEGFGVRSLAEFLDITLDRPAGGSAGAVLSANGLPGRLVTVDALQRPQHLELLVAHGVRIHR